MARFMYWKLKSQLTLIGKMYKSSVPPVFNCRHLTFHTTIAAILQCIAEVGEQFFPAFYNWRH
ncbi:hypothetical protein Hanom_Chr08g00708661 [Helianthus anomalus]